MSADGRLSVCEWVENPYRGNTPYATGEEGVTYQAILTLHMTVGKALSKSYVASHRVPSHQWYNVYTGDNWQTQELDLAAKALYQQPHGYHWSNKHAYNIQTELVGVPVVNVVTYTDGECYNIARDVIVPQVLWLRERGMDVDLTQVHQVENSSGSASEYWFGRCSEDEMARFNGLTQHIKWPYNDHWDCSIEKLWLIAQYAREILGDTEEETDLVGQVADLIKGDTDLLKELMFSMIRESREREGWILDMLTRGQVASRDEEDEVQHVKLDDLQRKTDEIIAKLGTPNG